MDGVNDGTPCRQWADLELPRPRFDRQVKLITRIRLIDAGPMLDLACLFMHSEIGL